MLPNNNATISFYKRELPPTCIDYASTSGKELFKLALQAGYMESYFRLASQFTTQSEPAFCGLGTLSMVLNSFGVDPLRPWKKTPWRWFSDEMFDCCRPLEEIKSTGITLGEFGCLAVCNGLSAKVYRADKVTKEKFFSDIIRSSASEDEVIVASYDRRTLKQTGSGHFSPLGGYCSERNMVLILDVARFKYPPHWVSLDLLWDALHPIDPDTSKPRGYVVLKRRDVVGSTLPKLSLTTTSIATLMRSLVEFPKSVVKDLPTLASLTTDAVLVNLMTCIPEELNEIIQERTMDDLQPNLALPPESMLDLTPPSAVELNAPCCTTLSEERKRDQKRALVSIRLQYNKQLAQLIRRVHETPLCIRVVNAMRRGVARQRSVSLTQLPGTTVVPDQAGLTQHCTSCNYCRPDELDLSNSSEDLVGLAESRRTDPKTPAFLTMLLLSLPLAVLLPPESVLLQHNPLLLEEMQELWNIDHVPLLVKSELHLFRKQVNALVHAWCEECSSDLMTTSLGTRCLSFGSRDAAHMHDIGNFTHTVGAACSTTSGGSGTMSVQVGVSCQDRQPARSGHDPSPA